MRAEYKLIPEINKSVLIKRKITLDENNNVTQHANIGTDLGYTHKVVWSNAILFLSLHILALYGGFILLTGRVSLITFIWAFIYSYCGIEGVTIGAHRMYTHKSFKAKPLLRAALIIFMTMSGQNSIFVWCRDHRLHHRYSDTDGDPHNAKRGFFFSHIGWLMTKKHPLVIELGKNIDVSDLLSDWMVVFQRKHYLKLFFVLVVVIPVWVPVHFFSESFFNSILVCGILRYVLQLNGTWLVNSAAHLCGTRPYDQYLQPVESWFVALISLGEGWHNYHHTFPWDYKAAELSMHFNTSATIIRLFEKVGLAYDLKTASPEMIEKRVMRTGDGTHYILGNDEARTSVAALGVVHPLNPTYTTTFKAPEATVSVKGLPLYHEKDVLNLD